MEQASTSRLQPGMEPIPGYRLLEPLGQGGFGLVWKCEAPGGLNKAIKFVDGNSAAAQERAALDRMKKLRHPFILSLERVEEIDGMLVIVMELADQSLYSVYSSYRERGQPGLPREELLRYLNEAAEALDWMNFEHGLQHLDIKPHNLFLVCNHIKIADFGLVHALAEEVGTFSGPRKGGVTPLYSAPELLRGSISRHSDQYSLAVVYQQLLTGIVPFWHENVYELMMQHLSSEPDLLALPEEDRPIVARALAKIPEQRFASCQQFVQALMTVSSNASVSSGVWQKNSTTTEAGGARTPPPNNPANDEAKAILAEESPMPLSLGHAGVHPQETPTRRIRALTPRQLAASEIGQEGLRFAPDWPTADQSPAKAFSSEQESTVYHPPPVDSACDSREGSADLEHPAPTAVTLPGYRFISCLSQSQLGDLWSAVDERGRLLRAMCLLGFVRYDARMIAHLQALRDVALPTTEVHWTSAERLVVLTDWKEGTLRDRFEKHVAEGRSGIPRAELLQLLRSAAEALDGLFRRHRLLHLGLHPRNLLIEGERVWIADFGLIPLVWMPTGQSAAVPNSRYTAPELFDRRSSRSADQYSLAMIYAEMLTGVHPRPQRPESGFHRRISKGTTRTGATMRAVRLELDLLPAHDRVVVARALSPDPAKRFDCCVEFIEALELAGQPVPVPQPRYEDLPPVIPFGVLRGDPINPDLVLPPVAKIVADLIRPKAASSDSRIILGPANAKYTVLPDGSWEYRCPLQLIPGTIPLKVEGFRHRWNARLLEETEFTYRLSLDVPVPRTFWERVIKQPRRVFVEIHVEPGPAIIRTTEARVRIHYDAEQNQQERVMATMGPLIFDTIREYLHTTTEQRQRQRWPMTEEIHAYPVLPTMELGKTLLGTSKDISYEGIRFQLPGELPSEYVYLHLCKRSEALGFALLARTVRCRTVAEGWEYGARFLSAEAPNPT